MGQVSWGGGGKRLPAVKPQLRNALCLVSASVSLTLLHTLLFRRETTNNSPFCHQSSTHILLILLWNIYRRVHGPLEDYSTSVLHSINSMVQMSDSPIVKYIHELVYNQISLFLVIITFHNSSSGQWS